MLVAWTSAGAAVKEGSGQVWGDLFKTQNKQVLVIELDVIE